MSYASFEIKTSLQFFDMFKKQVEEFKKDHLSSEKAIIAFVVGYHLREWIFKEHKTTIKTKLGINIETKDDFNGYVNNEFKLTDDISDTLKYFKLVKDICNGSKHFDAESVKMVKSSYVESGFNESFSDGFSHGKLMIQPIIDNQIDALELIERLVKYYYQLFKN